MREHENAVVVNDLRSECLMATRAWPCMVVNNLGFYSGLKRNSPGDIVIARSWSETANTANTTTNHVIGSYSIQTRRHNRESSQ